MFIGKKPLEAVSSRSQQQTELDSFHFLDLESIRFISSSTAWSIMTQEDGSSAKMKLVNDLLERFCIKEKRKNLSVLQA